MKCRSPIISGLMTVVLAAIMSGCGSSEPAADDQATAMPSNPGSYARGLRAIPEARELQKTINARHDQVMSELD